MTSKRRKPNPAEPGEKPGYKLDVRGLIVMIVVAAASGPVNLSLGFTTWTIALSFLPADPVLRRSIEAPYVIGSQFIVALLVIGICGWVVNRFTTMPFTWGIVLGSAIALATNPLVFIALS